VSAHSATEASAAANSAVASQRDGAVASGPQPLEVIAGKYRLERVLGAGGMGAVYLATHLELDSKVAVKFVHATIFQHPVVSARFLREARAVVQIESEHVARVLDVGRLPDGTPFMVMEYLDGQDLSEVLQRGTLSVHDAVDYVIQACSAMSEAHAMGIVHRDLKPANLFLTYRRDRTPVIKVLDFGISKWDEPQAVNHALTNPSVLMGSPAYMSPEQLRNAGSVDHRTDIWSLGVILFELLGGQPAFTGDGLPLLMMAIMQREPLALESLRTDIPPGLSEIIRRCLMKDPELRYQSVRELASALLPFAPRRSHWDIERMSRAAGLGTSHLVHSSAPPTRPSQVPSGPAPSDVAPGHSGVTANTWVEDKPASGAAPRGGRERNKTAKLTLLGLAALGGLGVATYLWLPVQDREPAPEGVGTNSSSVPIAADPTDTNVAIPSGAPSAAASVGVGNAPPPRTAPRVSGSVSAPSASAADPRRAPATAGTAVVRQPPRRPATPPPRRPTLASDRQNLSSNPSQGMPSPVNSVGQSATHDADRTPSKGSPRSEKPRATNPLEMELQ
jgi:eukaryotic-like serine/threonine-protein kinase